MYTLWAHRVAVAYKHRTAAVALNVIPCPTHQGRRVAVPVRGYIAKDVLDYFLREVCHCDAPWNPNKAPLLVQLPCLLTNKQHGHELIADIDIN
jgi:hypothetical protein